MADNRAALKTALKAADLAAKAVTDPADFDLAMTAKANAYGDAIAVFALGLKGKADAAGPTPMLDSLSGAVTGTTTME